MAALICALMPAQAQCPAAARETLAIVQIKAQAQGGDLVLEDGRLLRLAGLPPPSDEAASQRREMALALWTGRDLQLALASPAPDRWGRLVGDLVLPTSGTGPALTLALDLTARGLALPDPARVLPGCREAFALAEKQARSVGPSRSQNSFAARFPTTSRQAALAVSPQGPADGTSDAPAADGAAIDPLDLETAKARAGQFAAFEGRLVSVGERQRVTYLNFAWHRTKGASIVVPARLWRDMQQRGWTAESLPRKRVRARGLLVFRDGPSLTLVSLSHFEVLD